MSERLSYGRPAYRLRGPFPLRLGCRLRQANRSTRLGADSGEGRRPKCFGVTRRCEPSSRQQHRDALMRRAGAFSR
jgi:hypothetical protein